MDHQKSSTSMQIENVFDSDLRSQIFRIVYILQISARAFLLLSTFVFLSKEPLLAAIGFDTDENGPPKVEVTKEILGTAPSEHIRVAITTL